MSVKNSVQDGELNSRVEQLLEQIESLTMDEKAKLTEKLLSIPEISVISNNLDSDNIIEQIKMMPLEQLGYVLQVIGQRVMSESNWYNSDRFSNSQR